MSLKYYYDILSQPSRAVFLYLKHAKIPFIDNAIDLRKGFNRTDTFKAINPFMKVPCIQHGSFNLAESVAIMTYLQDTFKPADHWYPSDIQKRARVNEFNAWYPAGLRASASMVFRVQVLEPLATGKPFDVDRLNNYKAELQQSLDVLETIFLARGRYLAGDEISIADLTAVCELIQPLATGVPIEDASRPKVSDWLGRVKADLAPDFDDVHRGIMKVGSRFQERQKASQL